MWEDYQVVDPATVNETCSYEASYYGSKRKPVRLFRNKSADPLGGRYRCSKCSKSYRWKHHLVEHVKMSCGQKKVECCPYCSYKSNRKWNLKSHMRRIHADESFYSCPMGFLMNCQKVTYPCKNCGKVYNYYSSLARHLKHECGVEPKFHCPLCPYRTKHKSSLNTHLNGRHMKLLTEFYAMPNGNKSRPGKW
ncbi:unnamed protein product [Xylocopa violacea]|uniref:C2H2-type domain-containing protein n=1 Tax=Xylocopa violacea TaxID=135666 RepID=A0ABP1NFV9_XYLVO